MKRLVIQFEYGGERMSRAVDAENVLSAFTQLQRHFPGAKPLRVRCGTDVLWGEPLPNVEGVSMVGDYEVAVLRQQYPGFF